MTERKCPACGQHIDDENAEPPPPVIVTQAAQLVDMAIRLGTVQAEDRAEKINGAAVLILAMSTLVPMPAGGPVDPQS